MMKRDLRFSRRRLLKSIGAGAALLPMLQSDKTDAACYVSGIKRMFILCWTNGMLSSINNWATAGNDPSSWQLGSMGFQDSLKPYMADLLLLKGLDYKFIKDMPGGGERTGHAVFPGMLTGAFYKTVGSTNADLGGAISVDQYVGKQLQAKGYKGLVSLNQQAFPHSTGYLSWASSGQVVLPEPDPNKLYNLYFKGALPAVMPPPVTGTGGKSGAGGAPPVDNTAKIQKSILDYVVNDLNRFSKIVGTEDQKHIGEHLESVRNIEMRLQSMGQGTPMGTDGGAPISVANGTCAFPNTASEPSGVTSAVNTPAIAKLHMDLALAAFGADLTRVAVMQIGDQGDAYLDMSWLGSEFSSPGGKLLPSDNNTGLINGFHAIAHENTMRKVTCDAWFQSQAAYMIGQLKSITDGTGKSMLDSSVFVGMNSMRTGTHETTGVPVIMAGSCGGYFKTGRSLALPAGTPNNGLLVALCNAMGTPVSTFGEASYGGELTVLKG